MAWNRSSPRRSSSWMVSGPCWRSSSARVSLPDVLDADDGAAGVGRSGLEGLVEEAGHVRVVERGELLAPRVPGGGRRRR